VLNATRFIALHVVSTTNTRVLTKLGKNLSRCCVRVNAFVNIAESRDCLIKQASNSRIRRVLWLVKKMDDFDTSVNAK